MIKKNLEVVVWEAGGKVVVLAWLLEREEDGENTEREKKKTNFCCSLLYI